MAHTSSPSSFLHIRWFVKLGHEAISGLLVRWLAFTFVGHGLLDVALSSVTIGG
jgi:hypothetical protein